MLSIFIILFFSSGFLISQSNDSFYCSVQESYIGLNPKIYENRKDTTLKIYLSEYNIFQKYAISRSVE